ncbi:hypothetical protein BDV95DRAFT_584417 [Massariosphaeria phaeospora]|uniref:Uncharacterized protein n=1 Tax=Massariosphaeria phaeospora TaxID=100035 RepID=A0A7C8I2D3_9PLEO|nr:hypothetical protein BDV95DRAFT_584417 [Massariosphaeria phaeospora]
MNFLRMLREVISPGVCAASLALGSCMAPTGAFGHEHPLQLQATELQATEPHLQPSFISPKLTVHITFQRVAKGCLLAVLFRCSN